MKVSRSLKKFDESLGESFTKVWVKVSRKFHESLVETRMTKDCKRLQKMTKEFTVCNALYSSLKSHFNAFRHSAFRHLDFGFRHAWEGPGPTQIDTWVLTRDATHSMIFYRVNRVCGYFETA